MRSPALAVLEAVADRRPASPARRPNIGGAERAAGVVTGALLIGWGLRRRSLASAIGAMVGGALLYRGARGRSRLYEAIGISMARPTRVERVMTVNRPAAELHRAWRDADVRSRVMLGADELELLTDSPEDMVSWRTDGRDGVGQISFRAAPGGRGTEVRLLLDGVGAAAADEILRRFKYLVETGEIPTSTQQPSGRCA